MPEGADASGGRKGKGAGKAILLAAGIIAVVGIGAFVVRGLLSSSNGASSPQAAVENLTDALNREDPAAAAAAIVPEEVRSLSDVLDATEARAQDAGLAPKSSPYAGIDIKVDDLEFEVDELSDDVAKVTVTDGSISYDVQEGKLSETTRGLAGDSGFADGGTVDVEDFDDPSSSWNIDDDPYLIVVKRDGSWYVSLAYTAAEYYAEAADLPEGDFDADLTETAPADDPEKAVRQFAEAVGNIDVDETASLVPNDEWSVLDVYRDAIDETISQAQDDGELNDVAFSIDDVDLRTTDLAGGAKKVIIEGASGEVSWEGYDGQEDRDWDFDGRCLTVDDGGESCIRGESYYGRSLGFEEAYVVVVPEDGGWVVSPVATVTELAKEVVPKITDEMVFAAFGRPDLIEPSGSLEPGKPKEVPLNEAGYATLTFSPTADRTYVLSSDDEWVDVFDADGDLVWDDGYVGDGAVYDLEKGTYHVVVSRDDYDGGAPAEVQAVRVDAKPLPGGALGGTPIEGSLDAEQPLVDYAFSPTSDATVLLDSQGDDVDAEISDSAGDYICSTSEECELYAGEDYHLRVSTWDDESAEFSLAFTTDGVDKTITETMTFSGSLDTEESVDFTVDAEESISIRVIDESGQGDIDCESSDGDYYEADGDESFTVSGPGSVDISCFYYDGSSGDYTIEATGD